MSLCSGNRRSEMPGQKNRLTADSWNMHFTDKTDSAPSLKLVAHLAPRARPRQAAGLTTRGYVWRCSPWWWRRRLPLRLLRYTDLASAEPWPYDGLLSSFRILRGVLSVDDVQRTVGMCALALVTDRMHANLCEKCPPKRSKKDQGSARHVVAEATHLHAGDG